VHQDQYVGEVAAVPVPELALGVVPPAVVLPAGGQRARIGERGHQPDHRLAAQPGHPDRGGRTERAAIAQVAGNVLAAGPDGATGVIQGVVARPCQRAHLGQRQLDRDQVSGCGAEAQFTTTVATPAPGVPAGVDSQAGVIRQASVGIEAIFTPAGNRTRTGLVKELAVLPSPSSPWVPRPQAYRLPSASSAYWAPLEVPTSATFPGSRTAAGDVRVPKLPGRPPKNDPQDRTVAVACGLAATAGGWPPEQPPARVAASTAADSRRPACSGLFLASRAVVVTLPLCECRNCRQYRPETTGISGRSLDG